MFNPDDYTNLRNVVKRTCKIEVASNYKLILLRQVIEHFTGYNKFDNVTFETSFEVETYDDDDIINCCCSKIIKQKYLLTHKPTNITFIVGSNCIKKAIPYLSADFFKEKCKQCKIVAINKKTNVGKLGFCSSICEIHYKFPQKKCSVCNKNISSKYSKCYKCSFTNCVECDETISVDTSYDNKCNQCMFQKCLII